MKVGVLGGGQLGRMLALAGYPLGLRFRFLDPSPQSPARFLGEFHEARYDDAEALQRFADGLDVATYEFENVPPTAVNAIRPFAPVFPPRAALEMAQERLTEKEFFTRLGIPTPEYAAIDSRADFAVAVEKVGLPAMLKTRRMGYDGKGQAFLRTPAEANEAQYQADAATLILERFVPFDRELSILAVRGRDGETAFYPLVGNLHRGGILRRSYAPAHGLTPELQAQAEDYARRVLDALEYVGVLAIEFFEIDGELLANEMAPRVHNSGHWTIEGAETSQFENHLRAVCGLPLGSTAVRGHAAMVNLIGAAPAPADVLNIPGAHLHLYDKSPAPGRKLGHVTVCVPDLETRAEILARVQSLLNE